MSEFRDKLIAMGKGKIKLKEVIETLDELMARTPAEAASVRKLLDAARRGGLPDKVHARMVQVVDRAVAASMQGDETVMPPRAGATQSPAWAETVVAELGDDIAISGARAQSTPDNDATRFLDNDATRFLDNEVDATVLSKPAPVPPSDGGSDATVMGRGADNDATAMGRGADNDATVMGRGADNDATVMGRGADNDATVAVDADDDEGDTAFNPTELESGNDGAELSPPAADDVTIINHDENDATMVSTKDIDAAFDVLDPGNLAAADMRRHSTTGASDPTDMSQAAPSTRPAELEFKEGSVLRNRFILEKKLGEGGMGAVWKGIDKLKQEARDRNPYVAIKLLQGDFRDHPEAFIALQRETAKQQRLAHPNIATVFDFDRDDNTLTVFMTMEVLNGDDLAAFIRRKMPADGLPYEEAMDLIEQLGQGLAYAHQAGLVHSDLKPGNCFLTNENTVKLLDFGIARASKTKSDAEGETTVFDPGDLGALTPAYATIEMFDGVPPDPRDDIYALAIIAYQLLTGKHPYGKVNAPKAEETALTVLPIDKLTKRQNRAIAQGLAFRRDDRTETVEDLLEGLRVKKRNIVTTVVLPIVAAAAIIGIVTPIVLDTIAEQERESIIEIITSKQPDALASGLARVVSLESDDQRRQVLEDDRTRTAVIKLFTEGGEAGIAQGLTLLRGVSAGFTEDIKGVAAVEDSVVRLYETKAARAFAPGANKLDYASATALVAKLRGIYPRAAGTFRLEQDLANQRTEALARIDDDFNRLIDTGKLLRSVDGLDIYALRDRALAMDPDSPLKATKLVTLTAGELAQQAIDVADFSQAQALLTASLDFAPEQDELADLRYQVQQELLRQRNVQLVDEIEARLRAQSASFTTLAAFQAARDDLIRLADLAPASEVLQELQAQLTAAFDADLGKLVEAKSWLDAEALLVDFAKIFNLAYLEDKRATLSAAEKSAEFELTMTPERSAAVQSRREAIAKLVSQPDFGSDWEIALQVPFKEMIALLPAGDAAMASVREQIANLYIDEAETARGNELTTRAKSLVARGRTFYPGFASFDRQLALIAETDILLERKRAEVARATRVKRNLTLVANKARANDTQAAETALTQLEKDASDAELAQVGVVRAELGLAYGRLAETIAEQSNWSAALKLVQRGLELAPGNDVLVRAESTYDAAYQKVVAIERFKELLAGDKALSDRTVERALERVKADFPERYNSKYKAEFTQLATQRLSRLPVNSVQNLRAAKAEADILQRHFPNVTQAALADLAKRMVTRTNALEGSDVNAAAQYLAAARALAPKDRALSSIKLKLPHPGAEQGRKLVAAGKLTEAEKLLAQVMKEAPEAPNLGPFRRDYLARKQLGEQNFANFAKYKRARRAKQGKPFLDKAIAAWTDNSAYRAELASLTEPTGPTNRYECTAKKAGLGKNNRATCFDTVGGARGPVLVVVPKGSNVGQFAIGKLEVTVADYNLFCRKTGCAAASGDGKLPVTGISISRADAYAAWLTQESGASYRLPTAAEWRHAANAGGKQPRKDFNCTVTVGNQTLKGQSLVTALSGKANGWGLINYVGNAKEWTKTGGSVEANGGAYTDPMSKCDVSLKESHSGGADSLTGFRVVREMG
jgi:serine/threonine protein kinase